MLDLDQVLELSLVCLSFSIQQVYIYLKHSKFVVPFQQLYALPLMFQFKE